MNKLVLSLTFGFLTGLFLLRPVLAQDTRYVEAFVLPGPDTTEVRLDSFQHQKAVVVLFTSSHCAWAMKYQERLSQLWDSFSPQGVTFLAINSNDASVSRRDAAARMGQTTSYPFPYLKDADQEVARQFQASKTPEVFVLLPDAEGRFQVVYQGAIDDNPLAPQQHYLQDALAHVLGGEMPAMATTDPSGCDIKWIETEEEEDEEP
ncbi:MAG: thioredoxin family protein [Bacteroidetes bacterium]|nr:MAG: thioredoxin family protein [Bacteroidota bacterium]